MSPKVNPFILNYQERLAAWKTTRQQIQQAATVDSKIQVCRDFWKQAPLEKQVLNWDDSVNWPTPWEQLKLNSYCSSSHSLAMAATFVMSDPESFADVRLRLITDRKNCIQKVILDTHGYCINHGFFDIQPLSQLQHVQTHDVWKWTGRLWESTRPK